MRYRKAHIICLVFLYLIISTCNKDNTEFNVYTSYWGETLWKLKIYNDDSLFIIPQGHCSNDTSGLILIDRKDDTLLLTGEEISSLPNLGKLVLTDNGLCLVDRNSNIYCRNETWQEKQLQEGIYVEEIERRLIELDFVKRIHANADSLDQRIAFFPVNIIHEENIKKYLFTVSLNTRIRYITLEKIKFDPSRDKFYKLDSLEEEWIEIN